MPRIAVVTPYHREPIEYLAQCHESVKTQGVQADHVMVADGFPNVALASWDVRHVVLPAAHGDGGATPRGIGSMLADAEGYDYVAYLDADNWYHPGHLRSLVELQQRSGAAACSSFRSFHRPDGTLLDISEEQEDLLQHVDTSCLLVHRSAFELFSLWTRMPRQLWSLNDRVFLAALRHGRFKVMASRERTVAYRTLYQIHYERAGLPLPEGFKPNDLLKPAYDWLTVRDGVTESVSRLGFWPLTYF